MTEELWKNSAIIAKRNVDSNQTPISVNLTELKQIIDVHSCLVLNQLPDEHYGIDIDGFTEVYDIEDVTTRSYKVDYANGVLYFHPNNIGKMLQVNYYGVGCTLLSASRIYTKYDKYGNVLETLEELLDKGKLYIQAIDALGGAVEVINRVENANATGTVLHENLLEDIEIGSELNKDLINNNHIAENTITTLIQKTETGNQTINNLTDKTNLANQKKQELEVTTSNANNKNTELNNTISTANNTDTKLKDTILSGQDSINKINATGNKSLIIGASQFINNEYTWKHDMNSEDLHVTFEDLATKLPLQPDYQRIDKNNILIRNSVEHPNLKVVLSASYYQGNSLLGTSVEEFIGDSIGTNIKKVRLKDSNGIVENPITDSDAVFMPDGSTKLTKKIDDINLQLTENINKIKNLKSINVLDFGAKGDGVTDNTQIINDLLANNDTKNLYFPNGIYIANIKVVLPNSTIIGQSMNDTIIKQIGNNHIVENKAHYTLIKSVTIEGNGKDLVSDSCGVYQKSTDASTYINYLRLFDINIKNINADGVHIEGSNVENIFSNIAITSCGKRNLYNEGHDLFCSNIKLQRANLENYINKGNNVNGVNFHVIYGNLSQINTDKNSSDLRYSWFEQGKRFSYSNMDIQDCYGHGVKLQNATGNINGIVVDSVGINQPESSWWLPNTANDCIGIDIVSSDVMINGRVVNWHNNTQGACYRTDNSSELTGTITYDTLYVKEPIVKTWNIYLTREDEVNKFLGICNLLQKSTITWDTSFTFNGSGSPVYDNSGRYGTRLLISNVVNSVSLLPNNIKRFNQDDFEITFTFTPSIAHDGINTRWIYNSTFGNLYIEILRASDGKTTTNATIGSELFTKNFKDTMAVGEPYRIFIKYKNNKINFRIYHYSVLKFNESYTFTTAKTFGETPEIVLGNLKTGQTYWCGNGGFENFMLSRAIPDYIDFKQIDQRIDTTPYTIYKSEFNNKL